MMRAIRRGWSRVRGTFGGRRRERELDEEIAAHLACIAEENMRAGMSEAEARRQAALTFGGVEAAKESWRDQRGFPLVRDLWQDARFAVRMLRRAPSTSIPAVLVLALGIGSATALYAVVYAMWLRPLPYADPGRLVSVTTLFGGFKMDALPSPDYAAWQGTRSVGALGAYSSGTAVVAAPGETVEVPSAQIGGSLLEILGVPATAGRAIQPADDRWGAPRVAMLSDALWRAQFRGEASAVGRSVRVDGELHAIVGVLPRGFRMPDGSRVDLVTPLALDETWLRHGSGGMKILYGVGRLQPGVAIGQARAEFATRLAASRAAAPDVYRDDATIHVVPLHEYGVREARPIAIVLLAAVGCILLIASANVASLLVARAAGRAREMAIRIALGAGAFRIARHLLMEGLALGAAGVAAGVAVARGLLAAVRGLRPAEIEAARLEPAVLAAAIAAGALCSLAFSFAPALRLGNLRLRRALVVAELGLSLALTVAAALLLQNLAKLHAVRPGFRTDRIVTASISLRGTRFAEAAGELRRELRDSLERAPGIVAVAFADSLPPTGAARVGAFSRADRPLPKAFDRADNVIVRRVDAKFFEAMGIPLLEGGAFARPDQAVVNRMLRDRYFPGEPVLGARVDGAQWKTVVGVAGDTRNDGLRNPTRPEIYLPLTDGPDHGGGITRRLGLSVVIRTAADPDFAASLLRDRLRGIDAGLVARVRLMDEHWKELQSAPRFQAVVFGGFAALALLMACAGVFGVLSHAVVLRRKEIGIRIALGARAGDVQRLVLREALLLALGGVAVGAPAALAGSKLIAGLLYDVRARDPITIAASAALLLAVALAASLLPARRAARQDPAATLRAE